MRRLAVACLVVASWLAGPASAFDSGCSGGGVAGTPCAEGPGAARSPWRAHNDEHREIWEKTIAKAGLPATVSQTSPLALRVFLGPDDVTIGGSPQPSLIPVDVREATRVIDRPPPNTIGEFAQLPDWSYALWDWAGGNEVCPIAVAGWPTTDPVSCHEFRTHMGPVNSSHFPPQSRDYWAHYHQLALERATACDVLAQRLGAQRADFREFVLECEQQAMVLEAIAHHFLHDTWSSGHMWERWGSSEPADYGEDFVSPVIVGAISGLVHGARSVLQPAPPLDVYFDVNDPLSYPTAGVEWRATPTAPLNAGGGDDFLDRLLEDDALETQRTALFRCAVSSVREVFSKLSSPELGAMAAADPELCCVDPATACFGQRATNAAMQLGAGLDFHDQGVPFHVPLNPEVAARVVSNVGSPTSLGVELVNVASQIDLWAKISPGGTQAASGGIGDLLGNRVNSAYAGRVASYVDPPLPWPSRQSPRPEAETIAAVFHRAHVTDWCELHDDDFLSGLRDHVRDAVEADDAALQNVAVEACTEFARRHTRPFDASGPISDSLCALAADDTASPARLDLRGSGPYSAALTWCSCGDGKVEPWEACDESAGDAGDEACPGRCRAADHTQTIGGVSVNDGCTCREPAPGFVPVEVLTVTYQRDIPRYLALAGMWITPRAGEGIGSRYCLQIDGQGIVGPYGPLFYDPPPREYLAELSMPCKGANLEPTAEECVGQFGGKLLAKHIAGIWGFPSNDPLHISCAFGSPPICTVAGGVEHLSPYTAATFSARPWSASEPCFF